MDKKTLIELAKRELEKRINSIKDSLQKEMEAYKESPDARQTWSDTSRSRIESVMNALQRQLIEEQKNLELFNLIDEKPTEAIGMGSLAKVISQEEEYFYLFAPRGGEKIEIAKPKINVLLVSIDSPIGQALSGHKAGEIIGVKIPDGIKKLEIKEVY